jgi:GNAT superfamily N-acetyltransferase
MSDTVTLNTGEELVCRVIEDPDDDAVPHLMELLGHKGGLWQYHLDEWRAGNVKRLSTRFYVGAIGDELVANIMVVSFRGIGLMGHVFTSPKHRRKGICDELMRFHMNDWSERGCTALFLNTGHDSAPFRIYERHGYRPIQSRPGSRWWSPTVTELDEVWKQMYSDLDKAETAGLHWQHWPSLNAFTQLPGEQTVRNVTYGLYGVAASEGTFLDIRHDASEKKSQVRTLETREGHICALATLAPEHRWGRTASTWVFDLFAHPDLDEITVDLADEFEWPDAHILAYAADTDNQTIDALASLGFRPHSHVERFFDGSIGLVIMDRT